MLSLGSATRVYLVAGVTDMRKSFNTLFATVKNEMRLDPLSGHAFVFCNRKRDRVKVLFWDGSGLWVCAKRLEKGTFAWPGTSSKWFQVRHEELTLLLNGIDLQATRKRRWYREKSDTKNRVRSA